MARSVGRPALDEAARTAAATERGTDRVWPWWLQRQLDPQSAAFLPSGDEARRTNITDRNWTSIGNLDSPHRPTVDPRGLITMSVGGWSLDWWIGAEDRWHIPSREPSVRQSLVGGSPVVETLMRVPGGDVACLAYAVVASEGIGEQVVVEIENRSRLPVAVAFAVRPYHPLGLARVKQVELRGSIATIDGVPALRFVRPPPRSAWSPFAAGDVLRKVEGNETSTGDGSVRCPDDLAEAAFMFPLAHAATTRVGLPVVDALSPRDSAPAFTHAAVVARGWDAQARRGTRLALPAGRLASVVEATRRSLMLARPQLGSRDAVSIVGALDRVGFSAEAAEIVSHWPARSADLGADAAAVIAAATHWRLTRDRPMLDRLLPHVVEAAGRLDRGGRRAQRSVWLARGLLDAGELLEAAGLHDLAARARGRSRDVQPSLEESGEGASDWLAACEPLRLVSPSHSVVAAAREAVCRRGGIGGGVNRIAAPTGIDMRLTAGLAHVELVAGDRRALERLRWMVEVSSPTSGWPEVLHPALATGCGGDGHDPVVSATFAILVRDLLVRDGEPDNDDRGPTVVLLSLMPEEWEGQALEVHAAPTEAGTMSFAVRWHGSRPALIWELERRGDGRPVRVTAPGLDARWSTTDLRGEVLLRLDSRPAVADRGARNG